ncbi:hypothetical protein F2P81_015085 [Scophthalmus maximus]|uniref:Uncharacterized protein n=1 Tax=Scophthalmus maximus TaxID=52904 RepID=A0A6A4SJU4_SCOMX|nr:hypothetical protein F2P81_015085 [Scophthalmus maximus]
MTSRSNITTSYGIMEHRARVGTRFRMGTEYRYFLLPVHNWVSTRVPKSFRTNSIAIILIFKLGFCLTWCFIKGHWVTSVTKVYRCEVLCCQVAIKNKTGTRETLKTAAGQWDYIKKVNLYFLQHRQRIKTPRDGRHHSNTDIDIGRPDFINLVFADNHIHIYCRTVPDSGICSGLTRGAVMMKRSNVEENRNCRD